MTNPMKPAQTREQAEAVETPLASLNVSEEACRIGGDMIADAMGEMIAMERHPDDLAARVFVAMLAAQAPDKAAPCGEVATATLADRLARALAGMLDLFGGYETAENDAAISAMQAYGVDRWSMVADMGQGGLPRDFPAAIPSPDPGGSVGRGEAGQAIEAVLVRRIVLGKLDGYTTETAREIAAALSSLPAPTEAGWRELSPEDQFALAQRIAANVGYELTPEPEHPDSPHAKPAQAWSVEADPMPKRGEIRVLDGMRCRFIERELEGDKWEVLGPASPSPAEGGER